MIAIQQAKADDTDVAARLVSEALEIAEGITEEYDRNRAYRVIAYTQAEIGDVPGALAAARSIKDVNVRGRAYADVAVTQARAGDIPGALGVARNIEDAGSAEMAAERADTGEQLSRAPGDTGDSSASRRIVSAVLPDPHVEHPRRHAQRAGSVGMVRYGTGRVTAGSYPPAATRPTEIPRGLEHGCVRTG